MQSDRIDDDGVLSESAPDRDCPMELATAITRLRKSAGLTQPELAERAGVGLRFVRELEQGKPTVRLDKVKQVLDLLGHELCVRPKS